VTLRAIDGGRGAMSDEEFFREVVLRAELLVAHWALAHWQRRIT